MEILNANKRIKNTAHSAKKERRQGKVPGVLYGRGISNLLFEIGELELKKEIDINGEHGIVDINIDGEYHKTLIKEIQRDPATHKLVHLDLEEISNDTRVTTDVPIVFMGEESVSRNGGILQKEKSKVRIQCTGEEIPKSINIDVSKLHYGNTFRVKDIEFSSELTFIDDPNTVIAAVTDANTRINAETENTTNLTGSAISGE